jgi:hypothetical protein
MAIPIYKPWLTRRITTMARARYPEDSERAHLYEMTTFKAEQTAAYACEDELYGPYRKAWGGSGGCGVHGR